EASRTSDVAISGNYVYMANDSSGIRLVNVSNPENPTEMGHHLTPSYAWGVTISDNHAYVADAMAGLQIYENFLSGIELKSKYEEKVLRVSKKLFMKTTEVQIYGTRLPLIINVYDITGRIKEQKLVYNSHSVTIGADLNPGIYFVGTKDFKSEKIIKLK
ncbi:MAG: hypothetical protein P8Z50_03155, partial [candidate division WOR-3 bacterium]